MMFRILARRSVLVLLLAGVVGLAVAQDAAPPARPSFAGMINVDALIDNYARFLVRKYNLNPDQDAYTQQLLREKANAFLGGHRDELFALVDRLFDVRSGSEMDQQELIDWGRRALPLYEEAKQLIVTSNNDWREILNDDQRRIHDADVQLMYTSFQTTEAQLQRIVTGQMTVEEFKRGGRDANVAQPAKPGRAATPTAGAPTTQPSVKRVGSSVPQHSGATTQPAGPISPPPGPIAGHPPSNGPVSPLPNRSALSGTSRPAGGAAMPESQWEQYVRQFIEKYSLSEEQAQRARSILKDCQDQAQRYMQKHKSELDDLDKKIADAGKPGGDSKAVSDLNQRKTKLLEAVSRVFEQQLKPRLEKLPTRAQREAAEAGGKNKPATPAGATPSGTPPSGTGAMPPKGHPPYAPPQPPPPPDGSGDEGQDPVPPPP